MKNDMNNSSWGTSKAPGVSAAGRQRGAEYASGGDHQPRGSDKTSHVGSPTSRYAQGDASSAARSAPAWGGKG